MQKCAGVSKDEVNDICRPYVRLKQEYNDYKNFIINDRPRVEDAIKKTHDFHTRLLSILGYQTDHAYQEHCVVNDESTPVEMISELTIDGIDINRDLLAEILSDEQFVSGEYTTDFMAEFEEKHADRKK